MRHTACYALICPLLCSIRSACIQYGYGSTQLRRRAAAAVAGLDAFQDPILAKLAFGQSSQSTIYALTDHPNRLTVENATNDVETLECIWMRSRETPKRYVGFISVYLGLAYFSRFHCTWWTYWSNITAESRKNILGLRSLRQRRSNLSDPSSNIRIVHECQHE